MAERGRETLRHGPMKPFGLTNPHAPQVKPYAIVQLRQDNQLGTLFNMVGLPDQAAARRADPHLPYHSGSGETPSSPGSAACTATPISIRRSCSTQTLRLKADAAAALRRADHRLRRLCGVRRDGAAWPAASRRRSGAANACCRRRQPRRTARCIGHITGGHVEAIDAGPRSYPADEREFRVVPAVDPGARYGRGRQAAAWPGEGAGEEARALPSRAQRSCAVGGRRSSLGGGGVTVSTIRLLGATLPWRGRVASIERSEMRAGWGECRRFALTPPCLPHSRRSFGSRPSPSREGDGVCRSP